MAKPRKVPGLAPEMAFADAAARTIAVRGKEVFEYAPGVTELDDIERLHNMRVATRRLRAAMEVFAPCFPSDQRKPVLRDVKGLADALGVRRDRDVQIAAIERLRAQALPEHAPGIDSLLAELGAQQRIANEGVANAVAVAGESGLRERLVQLADEAER